MTPFLSDDLRTSPFGRFLRRAPRLLTTPPARIALMILALLALLAVLGVG